MPESPHIAVVRRLYDARGNPDIILDHAAAEVRLRRVRSPSAISRGYAPARS